jgi:hypothetical protein
MGGQIHNYLDDIAIVNYPCYYCNGFQAHNRKRRDRLRPWAAHNPCDRKFFICRQPHAVPGRVIFRVSTARTPPAFYLGPDLAGNRPDHGAVGDAGLALLQGRGGRERLSPGIPSGQRCLGSRVDQVQMMLFCRSKNFSIYNRTNHSIKFSILGRSAIFLRHS